MSMLSLTSTTQFRFDILKDKKYLPVVRSFLEEVAPLYPCFDSWFNFKFRKGFEFGERELIVSHWGDQIAGVSLLKKSIEEKKISTFYVAPDFRGNGIASELMELSLIELGSNRDILITVSEERNEQLKPLLSRYFEESKSEIGLYRDNSIEFFYRSA